MNKGKFERAIEDLEKGKKTTMQVFGDSMSPLIESGSVLTYKAYKKYKIGDIVCCYVGRTFIQAHLITRIDFEKGFMISNNKGHDNGWTKIIYGKVIKIEENIEKHLEGE